MTQVTINGNTYSDDGSSAKDMLNGGHRQWFFPLVSDVVVTAADVAADAAQAANAAANAAAVAGSTIATSTTSLSPTAGNKTLAIQTGKQFVGGNFVTISRTSDPTIIMHGIVTSYSGSTLQVTVGFAVGAVGPFTDWTVALSGAQGTVGASGNGNVGYLGLTSAYTVLATDRGKLIDCTANTFTLGFQGVATLGANWFAYIRNSGTGVITLDPNAAETINGSTTYTLGAGSIAALQCDGAVLRTVMVGPNELIRLPIFSTAAATASAVGSMEIMENAIIDTGLGASGGVGSLVYGNSLFACSSGIPSTDVATSPDGITWTFRALPSSNTWKLGTNGSNQWIATVPNLTTIAKSTDGITWSAGTALPAIANSSSSILYPIFNGSRCLIIANVESTVYVSTDNATTWSAAQTTPTVISSSTGMKVVGGLYLYFNNPSTTYYTSPTGLTGSWTSRTPPVTVGLTVWSDFDNAVLVRASGSTQVYRTTDGINWTLMNISTPNYVYTINGIYCNFRSTPPEGFTYHNNVKTIRISALAAGPTLTYGNNIFLLATGGAIPYVVRIAPNESTAATSLFAR